MTAKNETFKPEFTDTYNGVLDAAVQEQEIYQIATMLPHTTVHEIKEKLLIRNSTNESEAYMNMLMCRLKKAA